jgi:hypothetical protein
MLCAMAIAAVAQTNTPPALDPLPGDVGSFWKYGVAVVTPLIVTFVHWVAPKLPKVFLPSMTPLVGLVLGYAVNALGAANLGWVDMAEAGALAVFIREVVNQAITKRMEEPETLPPVPPLRR